MKIVLTATDSTGKNRVFTTEDLHTLSATQLAKLVKQGKTNDIHIVNARAGSYLRANPNTLRADNLDILSISQYKLFAALDDLGIAMGSRGFRRYWQLYQIYLKNRQAKGETVIHIDGRARTTMEYVTHKLSPHRKYVFDAADRFAVDPYLLGAIIIDEIARANVIEGISDIFLTQFVGWNASAGIAQVRMETARGLIKQEYYNPNPLDKQLSHERISRTLRSHLFQYVTQPKHSIFFAAARIRSLIDEWQPKIDLKQTPEIIATLYHLPYIQPKTDPGANERGLQIMQEFYPLAKRIFSAP